MPRALAAALVVALMVPAAASSRTAASATLPPLTAAAAASYDVVGERFIRRVNADVRLAPASLAKMLVALIVAEQLTPDEQISISLRAANTKPDNIRWPAGAVYTADELLHAMMMESSNGAAVAFADHIAGSVTTFSEIMDAKAASLGAHDTHIIEPSGLDAEGQYSTANDMALIAAAVVRDPWLSKVVRTKTHVIPWKNGGKYTLHTLNGWIVRFDGAIGVKNGYTTQAGNCLAAAATRFGRTVVTVVLNDRRWYADSVALMEDAFPRSVPGEVKPLPPKTAAASADVRAAAAAVPAGRTSKLLAATMAMGAATLTVAARRRQVVRRRRARAAARRSRLPSLPG
ncbi:MAG TPA: serine hydrolase [Actinomycetota bacterium]|nr:serine hydrolase [Actinomycetota bacterium]